MSRFAAATALWLCCAAPALGQSIVSSKHDLSVSGGGEIRATSETRVCIFCHVGHGGDPGGANRPESGAAYDPYASSTMKARGRGRPTGASQVCLSCHDGTIALGHTRTGGWIDLQGVSPDGRMPRGRGANLGTDLRGTHPISFKPVETSSARTPAPGAKVKLDRRGELQCTACHDPHREDLDPARRKFLVASNRGSALCTTCHTLPGWDANPAAHRTSTAVYPRERGAQTPYGTVGENACEACHLSHGGAARGRLLDPRHGDADDALCLSCHDGSVAAKAIAADVAKPYAHALRQAGGNTHDPAEGPDVAGRELPETRVTARRHVVCADCHDPHAATGRPSLRPRAGGALAGVWGIDLEGRRVDEVQYEYEVCFKCHGDSANLTRDQGGLGSTAPRRANPERNLRRVFARDAASSHPLTGPGRNLDVPSLVPGLSPGTQLVCGDCHGSDARADGARSAAGPHGSIYPFLLERNLATSDGTVEGPQAYALCYKCHVRETLLSERSAFAAHRTHVVDQRTPCTACHTAHGVASTSGDATRNAHLIDFDVSIVRATPEGIREYADGGARSGSCTLSCHGVLHSATRY